MLDRSLEPVRLICGGSLEDRRSSSDGFAGAHGPQIGLVVVAVTLLGHRDTFAKCCLSPDGDVGNRSLDVLRLVLGDLRLNEEVGHLIEAERAFGETDDDGLNLRQQLDSGENDDPLGAKGFRPEIACTRLVVAFDLQEESVCSLEQVLDDLLGGRQVVAIDRETVRRNLVEHIWPEDPNQLPLVEVLASWLIADGEVVPLEANAVGIGRHEVRATEESVLRIFATVAGSAVLRVHQRELVDDLVSQHLELRSTEHEVVRAVTENSDGHVDVVAGENAAAQVVLIAQNLECTVDIVAHAPGGVQTNLDGHRTADGELEDSTLLLFEPKQ